MGYCRKKSMAENISRKIFASATNPGEVGRRKTILTQAAKAFGAIRVEPVEVKFDSITLLVAFDDLEKAQAYQDDCKKQPLLRIPEGVPIRYARNLNKYHTFANCYERHCGLPQNAVPPE
jgi:hypothetical protein